MYFVWNLISILLAYAANFLVVLPGLILLSLIHGFHPIPFLDELWNLGIKGLMALPVPQNMLTAIIAFYVVIATIAGLFGFVGGLFPSDSFYPADSTRMQNPVTGTAGPDPGGHGLHFPKKRNGLDREIQLLRAE